MTQKDVEFLVQFVRSQPCPNMDEADARKECLDRLQAFWNAHKDASE